eukprot:jgi/Botrbrau1/10268/Bobra.0140s0021.1
MDNRDVQVLLDRTTLGEFVNTASAYRRGKKANVIVLEKNATLGDAMKVLAQHGVLSAPVLENRTREYIGFVDVRDILRGIIQAMYPELLEAEYVEKHSHLSSSELQTIAPDALLQPVSKLLHDNDLWFKGDNKSSLLKVVSQGFHIRPMASPSSSSASLREPKVAHRIAVFDVVPDEATPDGPTLAWQVQHIISQSDVLHFIATHMDHLGPIFQAPIKDLGIGTEGVRTVSAGTPALAAFAIMHHTGSSGLGLVKEEGGPLVGNLSMSDLRGLTMERFSALSLPAGEYVLLQNGVGLSWDDVLFGKRPEGAAEGEWDVVLQDVPLVTCTLESTVAEVIRSVLDAQIHRIYVMDADRRPIGIITLTDLLRLLTV